MPSSWDFRRILRVHPEKERNCAGFAPSKGRRCLNPINKFDLPTASRLLDQMDQSEHLFDVIDDLEELASLLLCKGVHRKSQVTEVCNKWKGLVLQEHLRRNEQEEKEKERSSVKLRNDLAKVKSIATQVKSELEEDEEFDMVRPTKPITSKAFTSINNGDLHDPFEIQESSATRPNIFTQPAARNSAQNTGILPSDFPIAPNNELPVGERKKGAFPIGVPYMPSPPNHEPSPTKAPRIAIAEQQEREITNGRPIKHKPNAMSNVAFAFGSKSGSTVPPFQFEVPARAKITEAENSPPSGPADVKAFSESNFGASTSSLAQALEKKKILEAPKRMPLQEKEVKAINMAFSTKRDPSPYEFGSRDKMPSSPFEFEVPLKLQPSLKIDDSTARPAVQFQVKPPEDNDSKISKGVGISIQPSKQLEESDLLSSTPANDPQPIPNNTNGILARPTTPSPKNEESFGFANITPNSTRYTTYLPARQQHGLVTPPETPEILIRSLGRPMGVSGYFKDELPREPGSPVPRVVRKPLPTSTPVRPDDGGEQKAEVCSGCGSNAGYGEGDCRCGRVEEEMRTGCLARFGFRRVSEKMKGQLKVMRKSISKRKENCSPSSNNGIELE